MSKFTLCVTFLLRQQQKGLVRKKKRSAKQTEMGNLQEFHSEKLEELMCLEKSVPQISSVAFKFGKKIIHCKSASNRFQPILCHEGIFGVHFYS